MDSEDEVSQFEIAMRKVYKETIKSGAIEGLRSFKVKIENSYIDLCNPCNYKDVPLTDSPFGKGREKVIDKNIRESLEYKFDDENIDYRISVLGQNIVTHNLGPKYYCKPYKFIIYEKNSFFDEHVDTAEKDLEYTLSLILPTDYKGGEFKFGNDITIEGHKDFIKYVLFRIECPHNVERVIEGFRIVLTYKVYAFQCTIVDIPKESFRNPEWITIPKVKTNNILISCPNIKHITDSLDKSGIVYKVVCGGSENVDKVYSKSTVFGDLEEEDQCEEHTFDDLVRYKKGYKVARSIILGTKRSTVTLLKPSDDRWTGNEPLMSDYELEYNKFLLINPDRECGSDESSTSASCEDSGDSSPEPIEKKMKMK
ncbi:hypothetical protein QAD02_012080 [Eretmocerus hayati]|uniref:Uncharacterized protein n=1 Tax=Eretmocerus hayati TaxID=131215 RepID=A0ACC2NZI9_9HYME|nr:hypothetical protein QAD02_012080 [Eretmocerus hayati]